MQEESPEGGRFKKEVVVDGHSYLLLIRDEGGPPELQVDKNYNCFTLKIYFENMKIPLILINVHHKETCSDVYYTNYGNYFSLRPGWMQLFLYLGKIVTNLINYLPLYS